jgi:hypothetical protein
MWKRPDYLFGPTLYTTHPDTEELRVIEDNISTLIVVLFAGSVQLRVGVMINQSVG